MRRYALLGANASGLAHTALCSTNASILSNFVDDLLKIIDVLSDLIDDY